MTGELAVQDGPASGASIVRLAWRSLLALWCAVLLVVAGGAGVLEYLGPLSQEAVVAADVIVPVAHPDVSLAKPADEVAEHPALLANGAAEAPPHPEASPPQAVAPPRAAGAIAPPDPALIEASANYPNGELPRIAPDHRTPMQVYAAHFDSADTRPRVAILIAGIGMSEGETSAAIAMLPPAVSLAVSPYAARTESFLSASRDAGHELLLSLPMEPQGYPLNDPGRSALLTGASQATNAQRLEWALTRFTGYVGATGALGAMRGERFAAASDQMAPLLETLAQRGLLYVDPRPNALRVASSAPRGAFRGVDLVLDEPSGPVELDRSLARLEQMARDRGVALGLAGRPSPVVVDRIATWALGLSARGVSLAPVSVVVQMPQLPQPPSVRITLPK